MKRKTNISVQDNTGIRVTSSMHVGEYNGYPSGDILDANATVNTIDNTVNEILGGVSADFDTLKELSDGLDSIKEDLDKVFFATYGVTTYNEVKEALNNGKVVYVDYRNSLMQYSHGKDEGSTIYFSTISMSKTYYCTVNVNNTWNVSSKILTESVSPITYSSLKTTRDGNSLTPGQLYRITDYITTTAQADTQSAGHQFDIIVCADATNKLSETAWAIRHDGDTYFANSKLEAWELKYCLDNDTTRFAWADDVNGKGVIYYMKDEWNNECPYDFKNIQFKRYKITICSKSPGLVGQYSVIGIDGITVDTNTPYWCYTFSMINLFEDIVDDVSVFQDKYPADEATYKSHSNIFKSYYDTVDDEYKSVLPNNVFVTDTNICSIEDDYSYGEFYGFYSNTFGNDCCSNTLGNNCRYNIFGNGCSNNVSGNNYSHNIFGNNCYNNTFGIGCYYNTFGNDCNHINFNKSYTYNCIIENSNRYITLTSNQTTSSSKPLRNITIAQGVNNTSTMKTISHNTVNDAIKTTYQPADSQTINV